MPNAVDVRPQKWEGVDVLYDDGEYSAIWGRYDGDKNRCLGVRWNGGNDEYGYPSQGGNPLWYVEHQSVTKEILLTLLYKVVSNPSLAKRDNYLKNILDALKEYSEQKDQLK